MHVAELSRFPVKSMAGEPRAIRVAELRSVEPLYRLAKQPKTILWAETGHQVPSPEQLSATVRFLRAHLE
ncbi:MAG: hypothetical protein E6K11_06340 [Methanobacteriota archaeon]|nr:MAG: hypothetical protein E6K11_06340 [Euryarchaeota archaeon]